MSEFFIASADTMTNTRSRRVLMTFVFLVAITSLKLDKIQARYIRSTSIQHRTDKVTTREPYTEYEPSAHPPFKTREESIQSPIIETYERVVLQGSMISISCPHFMAQSNQKPPIRSSRTIDRSDDVADGDIKSYDNKNLGLETEQFASATPIDPSDSAHPESESVKWFRNHVPLLNLNYFQQQQRNKVSKITKLNQTTETNNLNVASDEFQENRPRQPRGEQLSFERVSGANLIKQHDSMGNRDVNESVEDRKLANMLNANNRQHSLKKGAPQWYINSSGELVINKVSQYSAGRYTCLFAGKRSEVLLDVLLFTEVDMLGAERALRIEDIHQEDSMKPEGSITTMTANSETVGVEMGQKGYKQVEITALSDEFSTGSNDYGAGNGSSTGDLSDGVTTVATHLRRDTVHSINGPFVDQASNDVMDGKLHDSRVYGSNLHHRASDSSNEVYSIKSPSRGDAEQTTGKVTQSANVLKSLEKFQTRDQMMGPPSVSGRRIKINGQDLRYSKHLIAHIVINEAIHSSDMGSIPGFLFNKQQLHCPIVGQTGLNMEHLYPVLHPLCSSLRGSHSKLQDVDTAIHECLLLAQRLVIRLISRHGTKSYRGSRNCSNSLLELIWFKDGDQLLFDSTGKGTMSGSNLKLINIFDQIHLESSDGSARTSSEKTVTDGSQLDEKLHHSDERVCSVEGRTLEINGVKKDNTGHYTCAFRLDIARLSDIVHSLHSLSLKSTDKAEGIHVHKNGTVYHDDIVGMVDQRSIPVQSQEKRERIRSTDQNATSTKNNLMAKVNLFGSILRGERALADDQFLSCIEDAISKTKNTLIAVQTFSLSVNERSANSSKLWSDITDASNAYLRRKSADFRRLKRGMATTRDLGTLSGDTDVPKDKSLPTEATTIRGQTEENRWMDQPKPIELDGDGGSLHGDELDRLGRSNNRDDLIGIRRIRRHANARFVEWSSLLSSPPMKPFDGLQAATSDGQRGYNLLLNNAAKSDSSNIGPASDSLNRPVDYANEVGLNSWRLLTMAPRHDDDHGRSSGADKKDQQQERSHRLEYPERKDPITERGSIGTNIVPAENMMQSDADRESDDSRQETSKLQSQAPVFIIDSDRKDSGGQSEANGRSADDKGETKQPPRDRYDGEKATGGRLLNAWQGDKLQPSSAKARKGYELNSPSTQSSKMHQFLIDTPNTGPITLGSPAADSRKLVARKLPSARSNVHRRQFQSPSKGQAINELTSVSTSEYHPVPSAKTSVLGGHKTDPSIEPIIANPRGDELDETLMWTAGQYLYMHMRAIAASSMFGVEVDVEWSNERTNSSSIDSIGKANKDIAQLHQSRNNAVVSDVDEDLPQYSENNRDTVPFATIDVMSGQNLHLQCTAEALGRLPEVKWYKRISTIPNRLRNLVKLARRIGHDLYWPLADLNLLKEDQSSSRSKSFVCSESSTIFDNLVNQTFTVVSNIQLSQYNDRGRKDEGFEPIRSNPSPGGHYNLYACIVDADVRHNYATLGVHLRETTRKLQLEELNERLRSREIQTDVQPREYSPSILDKNGLADGQYDLFRDNQLQYPLRSYWIPIGNATSIHERLISSEFPIAPLLLSMIIAFVFSSLLALVYLTLRSYRSLTQHNSRNDIDFPDEDLQEENAMGRDEMDCNKQGCLSATSICVCHLYPSSVYDEISQMNTTQKHQQPLLYKAHSHRSDGLGNHLLDFDLPAEVPSKDQPGRCHIEPPYHNQSIVLDSCCQQLASSQVKEGLRINVFANPLENHQDQL